MSLTIGAIIFVLFVVEILGSGNAFEQWITHETSDSLGFERAEEILIICQRTVRLGSSFGVTVFSPERMTIANVRSAGVNFKQ